MTAHWIGVEDGRWKMRSVVIGFKALPGDHSDENLRRYLVCLLDHVGIMDKKKKQRCVDYLTVILRSLTTYCENQLYTATLDNTGNNNMTCKTIEDIHVH